MSRFFRYLSTRLTGSRATSNSRNHSSGEVTCSGKVREIIVCRVNLLDGTDMMTELPKHAVGQVLFEKVCNHIDLIEVDYFGLQFTDEFSVNHWMDSTKMIRKQVRNINRVCNEPFMFRFRVKFYTTPNRLTEEITRYEFFLQLKMDVLTGRLPCSFDEAAELSALALQSELGDYDPSLHNIGLVSEFRFVPKQTEELEAAVLHKFKFCRGMMPGVAETHYLNKAKTLEMYGVDMHSVVGRDGNSYSLGLTPSGILVFEGCQRIGLFIWPKIAKLQCSKRRLILEVLENDEEGQEQVHTFVFRASSDSACKHLWKCAVEHHVFFRISRLPNRNVFQSSSIFNRDNFVFNNRTKGSTTSEKISTHRSTAVARRSIQVVRRPSQRYNRRPTYHNGVNNNNNTDINNTYCLRRNNTAVPALGTSGLNRPEERQDVNNPRTRMSRAGSARSSHRMKAAPVTSSTGVEQSQRTEPVASTVRPTAPPLTPEPPHSQSTVYPASTAESQFINYAPYVPPQPESHGSTRRQHRPSQTVSPPRQVSVSSSTNYASPMQQSTVNISPNRQNPSYNSATLERPADGTMLYPSGRQITQVDVISNNNNNNNTLCQKYKVDPYTQQQQQQQQQQHRQQQQQQSQYFHKSASVRVQRNVKTPSNTGQRRRSVTTVVGDREVNNCTSSRVALDVNNYITAPHTENTQRLVPDNNRINQQQQQMPQYVTRIAVDQSQQSTGKRQPENKLIFTPVAPDVVPNCHTRSHSETRNTTKESQYSGATAYRQDETSNGLRARNRTGSQDQLLESTDRYTAQRNVSTLPSHSGKRVVLVTEV